MSGPALPPTRDYCPHCHIAGPHDPGRPLCPRCHGPLRPLDAYGRAVHPDAAQGPPSTTPGRPTTRAEQNHTYVPARTSPTRPQRPAPRPRPQVRWVAVRPPQARVPRRPHPATEPTPTPRYDHNPGWGLVDSPAAEPERSDRNFVEQAGVLLPRLLIGSAAVFTLAAAAQAWLYALHVINLEEPISSSMALAANGAVLVTGVAAVVSMVACLIGVAGWLVDERRRAYGRHDQLDPRSPRQIMLGCWLPVYNLLKPLAFFRELLDRRDDLLPDYTRKRLWWLWTAWLVINVLVATAVGIRIFADSLLWQANALVLVILSDLLSAALAAAVWWTLTRLLDKAAPASTPTRYLAAV